MSYFVDRGGRIYVNGGLYILIEIMEIVNVLEVILDLAPTEETGVRSQPLVHDVTVPVHLYQGKHRGTGRVT